MALDKRIKEGYNTPTRREKIQVNLDADLAEWARREAERRRCSISQVIRELVARAAEK